MSALPALRLGPSSGPAMKIACLVDEFPSLSQTFVLNQITGLIERGHEVDVYSREILTGERQHPEIATYGLLERTHAIACPRSRWVRLARGADLFARGMRSNARALLGSLNVFRYGRSAASLSLLFQTAPFFRSYDILHCQFGHNGQLGAIVKKLGLQQKLVVTFHGYDIRAGLPSAGAIYRELWKQADCLIAISEYNRSHLLQFGGDERKIVDHPVGIDCRRFSYRRRQAVSGAPVRLISVARLVEEKGLEFAIRALRWRLDDRPETLVRYEIIGAGPLRERLGRLIAELGLQEHVYLLGAKSHEEVAAALAGSDVLLAPSLAEALPVSLMEAHAVGLPVLATRVGSVHQIVSDGTSGFLVAPGDPAGLSLRLGELIDHPARRIEMGRRGRAHVEQHYDIERLNDRLVDIYRSLLAA